MISRIRSAYSRGLALVVGDARKRWYFVVPALVVLVLVFQYVRFNVTPSLPYRIVLQLPYAGTPLVRDDLVIYSANLSKFLDLPGNAALFKRVKGLPGDVIRVEERKVYVNGIYVGRAKERSVRGQVLEPIAPGVIPDGMVYVAGDAADSLDSRYAQQGLVPVKAIRSKVVPLV